MGTLFPDDPEYPDHKPLASGANDLKETVKDVAEDVKDKAPAVALIGMFVISGDGPDNLVRPDTRAVGRQAITWVSSATTNSAHEPMPFNQYDWRVPQRRSSNAHLMMPSSTNAALLMGGNTSNVMPFNNHDWQVPRRQTLHPSQMMFSTSDALLFGDTPSTTQDSTGIFKANNA